jgi:hypothetical protein
MAVPGQGTRDVPRELPFVFDNQDTHDTGSDAYLTEDLHLRQRVKSGAAGQRLRAPANGPVFCCKARAGPRPGVGRSLR